MWSMGRRAWRTVPAAGVVSAPSEHCGGGQGRGDAPGASAVGFEADPDGTAAQAGGGCGGAVDGDDQPDLDPSGSGAASSSQAAAGCLCALGAAEADAAVGQHATSRTVCLAFAEALVRFGVPEEVLTDNNKQFTDRFGKGGEVLFNKICRKNAITHRLSARHERPGDTSIATPITSATRWRSTS